MSKFVSDRKTCSVDGSVKIKTKIKNKTPGKVAVLVVGMHRSGSSALTRTLNLLGCSLPKTLLPASIGDNDLGFWESQVVMELNNQILSSAGSDWIDCQPVNPSWYQSPLKQEFMDRALQVLQSEIGSSSFFVLKDPRFCRLLPFWIEVLNEFGASSRIVIPIRNPIEVAVSLNKRNKIPFVVGWISWLRHVIEAEVASRGLTRSFLLYTDLLDCWPKVVDRIGHELDIIWPRRSAKVDFEVSSFLVKSLYRNRIDHNNVIDDAALSVWIKSVYEIAHRYALGLGKESDAISLDKTHKLFDEATPVFIRFIYEIEQIAKIVSGQELDIQEIQPKCTNRQLKLDQFEDDYRRITGELEIVRANSTQTNGELDQVRAKFQAAEKAQAEIVPLRQKLAETERVLATTKTEALAATKQVETGNAQDKITEQHHVAP